MRIGSAVLAATLLGCATAAPSRAPEPSDPAGPTGAWFPPAPSPTLELQEQLALVLAHRDQFAECGDVQQRAAPGLHGRALLEWDVSLAGEVRNVAVRDAPEPFAGCLLAAASTWRSREHTVPTPRFSLPVKF